MFLCAIKCEFRGQNSVKGGRIKNPGKIQFFLKRVKR